MRHLCSLALFLSCASDPPTIPHSDPAFFTSGDAKLAFAVPTPESVAILRALVDTRGKPFTWKIYPTAGHQLAVDFWPTVDAWLATLP